jgi:hypothetical protein
MKRLLTSFCLVLSVVGAIAVVVVLQRDASTREVKPSAEAEVYHASAAEKPPSGSPSSAGTFRKTYTSMPELPSARGFSRTLGHRASTNNPVPRQESLEEVLKRHAEWRRSYAEAGRMQDVARREAEIVERLNLLRKGMTVTDVLDVMGEPTAIRLVTPTEGWKVGTLEEAQRDPESVFKFIYSPYGHVNLFKSLGPYQQFELFFGEEGEVRGQLQFWTEPELPLLPPTLP